jgi:hypothetical protein
VRQYLETGDETIRDAAWDAAWAAARAADAARAAFIDKANAELERRLVGAIERGGFSR